MITKLQPYAFLEKYEAVNPGALTPESLDALCEAARRDHTFRNFPAGLALFHMPEIEIEEYAVGTYNGTDENYIVFCSEGRVYGRYIGATESNYYANCDDD